jgi:hypothetical protein
VRAWTRTLGTYFERNEKMPRLLIRLLISLVTLIVGVSLSDLSHVEKSPVSTPNQISPVLTVLTGTEAQPQVVCEAPLTFRPLMCALTMRGYDDAFEADDGTCVDVSSERFDSAGKARKEFAKRLASAKEIVERGPVAADGMGQPSGERVVAVYPDHAAVITIRGLWLESMTAASLKHIREAASLRHIREFEKR